MIGSGRAGCKRSVIPIERKDWDTWLNGTLEQAMALVKLPEPDLFVHGPAEPAQQVSLLPQPPHLPGD